MKTIRMEEMTWPDIKAAIEKGFTTVVVAVGSTEQHGPHLPEMTDSRIGDAVAHSVTLKLENALQARTISVGCSEHHLAFPGTISFQPATLKLVIRDYVDSLIRGGFKRVVLLPMHGGNFPIVQEALREALIAHQGIEIIGVTDLKKLLDCLSAASAEFGIKANESGAHAGESETSIMMALEKNLVIKDRFAPGYVGLTGEKEFKIIREQGMPALTKNGVLGDPRKATAEKGEVYLEKLTDFLLKEIRKDHPRMTTPSE